MQVGTITVSGRQVGVVTWALGEPDTFTPSLGDFGGSGNSQLGDNVYGSGSHHAATHSPHSPRGHSPEHHRATEGDSHSASRDLGDVPYSSSGNPFDRSRYSKELEEKPWLKDKMAHISLGENQDPRANTAVLETMMNRATVRGTSLEAQVRRHASSGKDEGGYYAGYASSYSSDKGKMFEHNLGEVLKGSNVSDYATDNSSGDLAAREKASGAFKHHKTINGESFFSPGHAEPAFRDRWQKLNKLAGEHEKSKTTAFDPGTMAP